MGYGGSKTTLAKNTTPEFRKKLVCIADELGMNPSYMAAIMYLESKFDPKQAYRAKNPDRVVAAGLIQFTKSTYSMIGMNPADVLKLDAMDQLDLVRKYYEGVGPSRIKSLGDYYLANFASGFLGRSDSTPIFKKADDRPPKTNGPNDPGFEPYRMNPALDPNKDGAITVGEVKSKIYPLVNAAKKHPKVVVDYDNSTPSSPDPSDPLSHSPPSSQLKTLALVGSVLGLGGAGLYYWMKKRGSDGT